MALTGLYPQCSVSLGHVATAWNSMRGQLNMLVRGQPRSSSTATMSTSEPITTEEAQETISGLLKDIGMNELSSHVKVETLSPILDTKAEAIATNWGESYVSTQSFFENKYGFSEKELLNGSLGTSKTFKVHLPGMRSHLFKNLSSVHNVPSRGFKTKRSGSGGIGGNTHQPEEDFSTLKYLRQSVFEKVNSSPSTTATTSSSSATLGSIKDNRFKSMINETESTEMQDKLKIAFAEGYQANDRRDGDSSTSGVAGGWMKKAIKFAWYGLLIWLTFQLIQGYSAFGGSEWNDVKISVLKGERFEINPEDIHVKFDDVKGVDEAKSELTDVVDFLRDPQKFQALGAKLPKGVLLVGPPGIGKTLLARAVAGEAEVPFFHASGSEFDEIFVGTGAKRIRQLFDAAKARAPCVIFIDEIDTVGAKRTSSQIHPYANQTINQLLSEMDGFQQNEGVIVLGATNRRDNLDKALLRPGRFDVEVRVFAPDLKGRRDILELYLKRIKHIKDIDIDKIARGTTGCTGADLENMVNQAALKAAKDGGESVTMAHMEFAKDKVLMGPAKKHKITDEETNKCTAYHEAGHTLVAYYTKDATAIHKVTIVPRGLSLGHTSFVPEKEQYNLTRSQLMAQMDVAMGGRVAEELINGIENVTTGASSDFQTATAIATAMVKRYGMSEKVGVRVISDEEVESGLQFMKVNDLSASMSELIDSEIKRLLQESYERAKSILRSHSAEHKALAQALMKYETLDADDIKALVEGKKFNKHPEKL